MNKPINYKEISILYSADDAIHFEYMNEMFEIVGPHLDEKVLELKNREDVGYSKTSGYSNPVTESDDSTWTIRDLEESDYKSFVFENPKQWKNLSE